MTKTRPVISISKQRDKHERFCGKIGLEGILKIKALCDPSTLISARQFVNPISDSITD
jgi:hypothetical protein